MASGFMGAPRECQGYWELSGDWAIRGCKGCIGGLAGSVGTQGSAGV